MQHFILHKRKQAGNHSTQKMLLYNNSEFSLLG